MKPNFRCPYCKTQIKVGKQLHAEYTCPNCHKQMIIREEEKTQGHVKYIKNFLIRK